MTEGELVVWIDADVRNFGSHFVTRLLEPLLVDPDVGLREGATTAVRCTVEPPGGGRVTELMARPLLLGAVPAAPRHRAAVERRVRRPARAPRGRPVRRGMGRGDRSAHRRRRTVRRGRDRAVRPRRARAPQPPARRALDAGDGGAPHLLATRRGRPTSASARRSPASAPTTRASTSRSTSASDRRW